MAVSFVNGGGISRSGSPASTVVPHVKSGKLTIGRQRLAALPEIPTITESGIGGFETSLWIGLHAPAATPPLIIERLNRETVRVLGLPEVKSQLAAQSIDTFLGTRQQFGALIKQDSEKWAKVIRTAGVKIE